MRPFLTEGPWIGSYTRRSRDELNNPALLENHRSLLSRTAQADGRVLSPDRMYEEIGSGESIEGRPVFRMLLKEWEALPPGTGGVLYVTELSRLTRDSEEGGPRILRALRRAGIRIRTPERTFELDDSGDKFMFQLLGLFGDQELQTIKRRLAAGQREARMKGALPNGTAPFGYLYSVEAKNLLPDPVRFPILVACCRRAVAEPVYRLAEEYGVPENGLLRALRNPTICGYPARHYGPRDPDNPHRKSYAPIPRAEWLWPEQQNTRYPHACTREEWETLQAALDARRDRRPRVHQGEGWCRDRVQFAGRPGRVRLGSYAVTRRAGGSVMCLTYELSQPVGATHLFIPRQTVHDAVLPVLVARLDHPAVREWLLSLEDESPLPVEPSRTGERETLIARLADCRRRYEAAVNAEEDADDPNHRMMLTRRRLRLQERLHALERELQALDAQGEEQQAVVQLSHLLPRAGGGFLEAWEEWDGMTRRLVVNGLLSLIEVTVEPTQPPRPHRREVTRIEWQPWVPAPS